ncbi:hypothetical protein K457DRAFT_1823898 [Linnemannia elongata AG-77]|uniref:Uncharacterized protein n=1 Tax=Linnemannia elongata AG-77 TaxID=1314771 RepID=A0A197JGM6_9FUNG|nr:hypothetical protein K457DRAFT_1823898 [Linnemannia elongata AG-77]
MFTLISCSGYIRFSEAIVVVFLVLAVDCASHGHNPYSMFQTVTQSYRVLMALHTTRYLEPRNCIPCSTDWRLIVLESCSLKLESQDTLNAFAWVSILGALNVSPQVSLRGLIDPTHTAIGLSEDCFNVASYSNNKRLVNMHSNSPYLHMGIL